MQDALDFNLISPEMHANPYPAFSWLRAHAPVHQVTMGSRQVWIISRYQDVEAVLKDQRFVRNERNAFDPSEFAQRFAYRLEQEQTGHAFLYHQMLNLDPPDHTRLRALVSLSFTPRLIEQWRERIQIIADGLLDRTQARGEMDLIEEFAFPLPMTVITEMLGVPLADRSQFRRWSNEVVEAAGLPGGWSTISGSMDALKTYMRDLIGQKRGQPTDDLLGELIRTEAQGEKLTEDELIAMVFLLLSAGHETTVNLIGNGVFTLLQHPEQMEQLKQHPALLPTAIEELLRYRGPVPAATQRRAREDLELDGKLIRRGDPVIVLLASANHDTQIFDHAEELDITREENRHLAFGKGIHYCLGAPLARLEGHIAIGTLLRRMPNLHLSIEPQELVWKSGLIMGLSTLPVAF
jgi:cytochrome P450